MVGCGGSFRVSVCCSDWCSDVGGGGNSAAAADDDDDDGCNSCYDFVCDIGDVDDGYNFDACGCFSDKRWDVGHGVDDDCVCGDGCCIGGGDVCNCGVDGCDCVGNCVCGGGYDSGIDDSWR